MGQRQEQEQRREQREQRREQQILAEIPLFLRLPALTVELPVRQPQQRRQHRVTIPHRRRD